MTPETRKWITDLDPQWREYYEERAGILEYVGSVPREIAEQAAWLETSAAMLKSRIAKLAEHQHNIPKTITPMKPLTVPHIAPMVDRKSMAAGETV